MHPVLELAVGLPVIFVLHELGHFIPARAFGIPVERFQVFFAPRSRAAERRFLGTTFALGWLPLGAFVVFRGHGRGGAVDVALEEWTFDRRPAWQRLLVILGGVAANFALGAFLVGLSSWQALGILSLALGAINTLPVPPLDGAHAWRVLREIAAHGFRGRPPRSLVRAPGRAESSIPKEYLTMESSLVRPALTNSQRLRQRIELVLPELVGVSRQILDHPRFREIYPEYCFTLHGLIRASVPMMEAALERSKTLSETDPVAEGLAVYFAKHVREEAFHDEWVLEDLELIGVDRSELLARLPSPTVASAVGSQYYWIRHYHPIALLGYISILEGYPPTLEYVDIMVERTGYPRKVFRTIERHAHLDPHHRDDLNAAIDALPLEPWHFKALGVSALHTVRLLSAALREIIENADTAARKA
jgi:hypothetical protein